MATTTNYGWTTPDDTALVKDGAAAIRTLGSSVDTTTKALNPSTTLGDIEYRSSTANTNTRLPIGSTGQILTVSGGVPAWATPAGSNANYSLLNTGGTSLTGATTITVSGISGMSKLFVLVNDASSANALSEIRIRLNTDSTTNYGYSAARFDATSTYAANSLTVESSTSTNYILLALTSSNAGSGATGYCAIDGANSSGIKTFAYSGSASASGGNNQSAYWGGGVYRGTSTISSISIVSATGNFDGGTIYVYGSAV